jgi:hypothetical protein
MVVTWPLYSNDRRFKSTRYYHFILDTIPLLL